MQKMNNDIYQEQPNYDVNVETKVIDNVDLVKRGFMDVTITTMYKGDVQKYDTTFIAQVNNNDVSG